MVSLRFAGLNDAGVEALRRMEGARLVPEGIIYPLGRGDCCDDSMADYYAQYDPPWWDDDVARRLPKPSTTYWVTRDGVSIPICAIEDGHLTNIILYLHKRGKYASPSLPALLEQARIRGLLPLKGSER